MPEIRRTRPRRDTFAFDDQEIAERVIRFYTQDDADRTHEKEARMQRYAKYRMWTEPKDWPWPEASNIPLSDIQEKGLRVEDTLHNAVMSARPPIGAKAIAKHNKEKEAKIDRLIDVQVFVEQDGEGVVGDMANAFVVDGHYVVFVPWVKEMRESSDLRLFDPIPDEVLPSEYFRAILVREFGNRVAVQRADGWDWQVEGTDGEPFEVRFYTRDDAVEMVVRREVTVYDGPRIILKEWDDVLFPARAANLHIPSPSNPHGAAHVILVDHPTVDEVRRLAEQGIYDRLDEDQLDALGTAGEAGTNQEMREQKDDLQGATETRDTRPQTESQRTVTRLMCFDLYAMERGAPAQDVVWVVIQDIKALCRARLLTEIYPSRVPRRPLVSRSMLPVRGRVAGISLPEQIEGLHDAMKAIIDQTIDGGTMKIIPPGFYRPSGSMKPETIAYSPGEMYPLNDPQRDVNFPTLNTQGEALGINLFTLIQQMEERNTAIGELQLGRVPQGRASALRTLGGMSLIAGQGEARPERILRRFFGGLAEIWGLIHEENQHFLPKEKQIRITGYPGAGEDPYMTIRPADVEGEYVFDFDANVLNTSKMALQQSLTAIAGYYVSAIAIQLGIVDADGIYRLLRDIGRAFGQDPDQYLKAPTPASNQPRLFAEEALAAIFEGQPPQGVPAEGAAQHFQKLVEFFQSDNIGLLSEAGQAVFRQYLQQIAQLAAEEQRVAQLAAAAEQMGMAGGQGQPGRPAESIQEPGGFPPVQQNELLDESLPGARGNGGA